jgi:hypothetical protein
MNKALVTYFKRMGLIKYEQILEKTKEQTKKKEGDVNEINND